MVKSRFSSLDVRGMVNSIRPEAVGCKLTNVYDINSKVYVLKLAKTGYKRFLLLESGMRFHLTDYARDKSNVPSNYTMKLRKHIRTRRLTGIRQLGSDRIVIFTFGYGENSFHLILEMYVSGNLVLVDHEYKILVLLRAHSDERSKVTVKEVYPLQNATGLLAVPLEQFGARVEQVIAEVAARQAAQEAKVEEVKEKGGGTNATGYKKRRQKHDHLPLSTILHRLVPFSDPALCSYCIAAVTGEADGRSLTIKDLSLDQVVSILRGAAEKALAALRSVSRPEDLGGGDLKTLVLAEEEVDGAADIGAEDDSEDEDKTVEAADEVGKTKVLFSASAESDPVAIRGWILQKSLQKSGVEAPSSCIQWTFDEFTPLQALVHGIDAEAILAFPSFHACVDQFFTKLEEHKVEEAKAQHASNVYAKVERIRVDQSRRLETLEAQQEEAERLASLIEANVDIVETALAMLNAMVASQFDWGELWREVKRQQKLGHPIAQHIHSLNLEQNHFGFLLCDEPDDDDLEAEGDRKMDVVTLDLGISAHANIARLHKHRKQTKVKTGKTADAAGRVIKQAERKAQQDLQKFQLKQSIRRVRETWWFEKFYWFVSSENYLVLAGRDATQTELLFRRYMKESDAFVYADVAGATVCFVKNLDNSEVPPATLREAGTLSLCRSTAWDKRIVISAWWVSLAQVSRQGETGERPPSGDCVIVEGFFVQGHRRFMPPVRLEMGITLLFHVADASVTRHKGERRSRYLEAISGVADADEQIVEDCNRSVSDDGEVAEESDAAMSVDGGQDEGGDHIASFDVRGRASPEEGLSFEEQNGDTPTADAIANGDAAGDAATEGIAIEEDHRRAGANDDDNDEGDGDGDGVASPEGDGEFEVSGRGDAARGANAGREDAPEEDASGRSGRLSKAERRKLKKGTPGAEEEHDFEPPPRTPAQEKVKAKAKPAPAPTAKAVPRGQKNKLKKIKEKYAEQDDEERELRLALLGSKPPKQVGAESAVGDEGAGETPIDWSVEAPTAAHDAGRGDGNRVVSSSQGGPEKAGKDGLQRNKGSGKGKADKRPPKAADLALDADALNDALSQLTRLDHLTGQPHPDDEVLYALPMVAPYCSLGGPYTLRVKVTPGTTKKGQAVRTCLKMFEAQIEKPAWQQLVTAIPEQDAASLLCIGGNCKLSTPGMQKLQEQVKKNKKMQAKEAEKSLRQKEKDASIPDS